MLGSSGKIEKSATSYIFIAFVIILWFIFNAVTYLFLIFAAGNENLKFDLAAAFIYSCVPAVPRSAVLLIVCSLSRFILESHIHNTVSLHIRGSGFQITQMNVSEELLCVMFSSINSVVMKVPHTPHNTGVQH